MSLRILFAWVIALQGCAVPAPEPETSPSPAAIAPEDAATESAPPTLQDAQMPATPWNVSFSDGNANQYRFWRDDPDSPARFTYTPVEPIHSSSGIYSGGEPREGELTPAQSEELWAHVDAVTADTDHHVEQRTKGTVVLEAATAEQTRLIQAFVGSGAALDKLIRFLRQFRDSTRD